MAGLKMVVETQQQQSSRKSNKKSSKSRHHRKQPAESYYDQPRHVEVKQMSQEDHLYDVVRPVDESAAYQNISDNNRAVYQNMDDM